MKPLHISYMIIRLLNTSLTILLLITCKRKICGRLGTHLWRNYVLVKNDAIGQQMKNATYSTLREQVAFINA